MIATLALAASLFAVHPVTQVIERDALRSWEADIGYTRAVRHGDTLYISGVTSSGGTVAEQMARIYAEIGEILAAHGLDSMAVVKETIYTRDIEAVKASIALRKGFYAGGLYPSASWVQVERLYQPDQDVEVEIEAAVDAAHGPSQP